MAHSPHTVILPIHTANLFSEAVDRAVTCLKRGEPVALPTETVYGLAANALDSDAVRRLYEIKGRPPQNPIIVHVASLAMARDCVRDWPASATTLASKFWPGPITFVLPKAQVIPDIVVAGGDSVGIRWPSHPFIQAVIQQCDFPLAAPSANISNAVSPTAPNHVWRTLRGKISLIIDGGQSQVGIESTVLDLTRTPPRILRPGMIHTEAIAAIIGDVERDPALHEEAIYRSPGSMPRHYSPNASLKIMTWENDQDLRDQLTSTRVSPDQTHIIAHTVIPTLQEIARISVIPHDAEAYARALYSEFHRCDQEGARMIVLEGVPDSEEWKGIADRLRRASHESTGNHVD